MNLYRRSIEVILQNQAGSGAYIASPNFPSYAYCWLRDGSFIAHAMDRAGEHESARVFFRWVHQVIQRHAWKVNRVLERLERDEPVEGEAFLHTRYTLEGEEATDRWWNFQLDGYGTWLWALAEHVGLSDDQALVDEVADSVQTTVRYLSALWEVPNYDLWEEHPEYLHPYTLSAIYAGLRAADRITTADNSSVSDIADQVRHFLLEHGVRNGYLTKHIVPAESGNGEENRFSSAPAHLRSPAPVDASLIGVATPYCLLSPDDPVMQATVVRIESDLHCSGGGVHRYLSDTYYGGGEWVLLAGWLGWYYTEVGEPARAAALLQWIESQADADGNLPEQVPTHLLAPDRYAEWEARWGPIAKPLLWSHAMYLILYDALESAERG